MEFNIVERFKGIERIPKDAANAEQVGTSLFLTGHLGERIAPRLDEYAAKARLPRRDFLRSAFGLSAAMLAVNEVTGMRFFEVSEAEAYDPAAKQELSVTRKAGADFIVDVHTPHLHPQGRLRQGRQHEREGDVVRPVAGRSGQGDGAAQRHQ